jgi:hypothetical protein
MTRVVHEPQASKGHRVVGEVRPDIEMTQQFDAACKKGGRAWIVCSGFGRGRAYDDSAKALVRQRKAGHKSRGARTDDDRVNAAIDGHGLFHSKEDAMSARFSSR